MRYDKFPVEIDGTYKPEPGDKIEVTFPDGTVTIGTVDHVTGNTAYTRNGFFLYAPHIEYESYSFRLLARKRQYAVGDIVNGRTLEELPYGTVFTRLYEDEDVWTGIILGYGNRYRRVDNNYSWNSLGRGLSFRLDYIPRTP